MSSDKFTVYNSSKDLYEKKVDVYVIPNHDNGVLSGRMEVVLALGIAILTEADFAKFFEQRCKKTSSATNLEEGKIEPIDFMKDTQGLLLYHKQIVQQNTENPPFQNFYALVYLDENQEDYDLKQKNYESHIAPLFKACGGGSYLVNKKILGSKNLAKEVADWEFFDRVSVILSLSHEKNMDHLPNSPLEKVLAASGLVFKPPKEKSSKDDTDTEDEDSPPAVPLKNLTIYNCNSFIPTMIKKGVKTVIREKLYENFVIWAKSEAHKFWQTDKFAQQGLRNSRRIKSQDKSKTTTAAAPKAANKAVKTGKRFMVQPKKVRNAQSASKSKEKTTKNAKLGEVKPTLADANFYSEKTQPHKKRVRNSQDQDVNLGTGLRSMKKQTKKIRKQILRNVRECERLFFYFPCPSVFPRCEPTRRLSLELPYKSQLKLPHQAQVLFTFNHYL